MNTSKVSGLLIALGIGVWAGSANAASISIGISTSLAVAPSNVVTAASNVGIGSYNGAIGNIDFTGNQTNSIGQGAPTVLPPLLLIGSTINASSTGNGDAYIWFTETG